jgi:lipoprotein-anchoring transpeptidase ErfK/SrfK
VLPALILVAAAPGAAAQVSDPDMVNAAAFDDQSGDPSEAVILKLQILLDRARISPGVIDGRMGESTRNALREFEKKSGLAADGRLDKATWQALSRDAGRVLLTYEVTGEDVAGPFAEKIPKDFAEMAAMDRLSYTGAEELLAEKFHMSEELLKALNSGTALEPGAKIIVPDVTGAEPEGKVARIEVDKGKGVLRGYDSEGRLLLAYPATIGSDDNPSPAGKMKVKGVARNPKYEYRPDKNFEQAGNDEPLTLPPGPNGPVGSIWIELSEDTYGIHGTDEPALVGKTSSHGCVRLTNWDAEELGSLVKFGMPVEFVS